MRKGTKLKMLSLALNGFDGESLPEIEKFLAKQDEDFNLVLSANPINKNDIAVVKQKFPNKLIF